MHFFSLQLLAALCVWGAILPVGAADPFFPFVKGRHWLYDGTVKFVQNGQVREKAITGWKSETVDTVEGTGFRAALLKGHPCDLMWYQPDKPRGDVIVVLTSRGELHQVFGDKNAVEKFARIRSTGRLPEGLLTSDTLLGRVGMKEGDRFGDPEQTAIGPRYCWVVLSVADAEPSHPVRGLPPGRLFPTYTLAYRTNPDHQNLVFSAGLGITFYEYVHHGTKGDCEVHLAAIGPVKSAEN